MTPTRFSRFLTWAPTLFALVSLLALATPAQAQSPEEQLQARFNEAMQALQGGEYEAAFQQFSALAAQLPASEFRASCLYNAACAASLNGSTESGLIRFAEAVRDGFRDLDHIAQDGDLDHIRDHAMFRHLIGMIQNGETEALNTLDVRTLAQRFLGNNGQTAPDEPASLTNGRHEASITLGERVSFPLVLAQTAHLRLTTESDLDLMMAIVGTDGSVLFRDDDSGGEYQPRIEADLSAGEYQVIVSGYADRAQGEFVLVVEGLPAGGATPGEGPPSAELEALREELYRAVDEEVDNLRRELRGEVDELLRRLAAGRRQTTPGEDDTPPEETPSGRPFLGLSVRPLTGPARELMGLPEGVGLLVQEVVADGPAAEAGLQVYDILVAFNGQRVGTVEEIGQILAGLRPGQQVALTVRRGEGDEHTLQVTLGNRDD